MTAQEQLELLRKRDEFILEKLESARESLAVVRDVHLPALKRSVEELRRAEALREEGTLEWLWRFWTRRG
jgi:hypothetical protein